MSLDASLAADRQGLEVVVVGGSAFHVSSIVDLEVVAVEEEVGVQTQIPPLRIPPLPNLARPILAIHNQRRLKRQPTKLRQLRA